MKDAEQESYIVTEAYDFSVLLYEAYSQIVFYGKADPSVMTAVFNSLWFAKADANEENTVIIESYAKHLYAQLTDRGYARLEYQLMDKEYKKLLHLH